MTCGCGQPEETHAHPHDADGHHHHDHGHSHDPARPHDYGNGEGHSHDHAHEASSSRTVRVEEDLLLKNRLLAERNRGWFEARGILALNLVSSPGAGKTTLLERTLRDLAEEWPCSVIEGDQQTDNDARRIQATGTPVTQINTGQVCHLDAQMIHDALQTLQPTQGSGVWIENVGNLVCPALFDLGEACKVVIASLPEGEDKPVKYPYMFQASPLILLNKVDLLPHLNFDMARFRELVGHVNPAALVIPLSAVSGEGLEEWYGWLREQRQALAALP